MTKYQALKLSGVLMILTGIPLLFSHLLSSITVQYTVALCMIVSAAFACLNACKNKNVQIPFHYHELHTVGFIVYGLAILFFATNNIRFINITGCFFIYYGMTELFFCFQLLNHRAKVNLQLKVFLTRIFVGVFTYLGSLFILNFCTGECKALIVYGIMFVLSGVNLILYKNILKNIEAPMEETQNTEHKTGF